MASPPEPKQIFRIAHPKFPLFDGTGTFRIGSRWVSPGSYVVHATESYALAILENLVHWNSIGVPAALQCVRAEVPGDIAQDTISQKRIAKLDPDDQSAFRKIGDNWYNKGKSSVLWVPSVVSPFEFNVLINQTHADFPKIKIVETLPAPLDPRLI